MLNNPFILGNLILGLALLLLLFMGQAWELLGPLAMILWIVLVGVGGHLVMKDRPE